MEHIQNKIHVAIFVSVFIIFIYLLTVSQNNKLSINKFEESSLVPIYFNEDKLLPELFEIAFGSGKNAGTQDKFIRETLHSLHNKKNYFNETWKLYSIIENPLDRFAATFINNCLNKSNKIEDNVCYGCMNNPTCVVNYLYKNLKKLISLQNHFYNPNEADRMFMPYYWRCNMQRDFNLFQMFNFTNSTLFNAQFQKLFQKKNVNHKDVASVMRRIKEVYDSDVNESVFNEKKSHIIKSLVDNHNVLLQFMSIYSTDYQYFNMLFPKFK
uniref:Uncharacterized protein n=1 Tax=Strongyloides papillosus TaxID=174720 RepID=A0A0N5BDZ2_STREA